MARRPLQELLARFPEEFPELREGGMLTGLFRSVVLPQMIVAAKKDEPRAWETTRSILARLVRVLELGPDDLFFANAGVAAGAAKASADADGPDRPASPAAAAGAARVETGGAKASEGGGDPSARASPPRDPLAQASEP